MKMLVVLIVALSVGAYGQEPTEGEEAAGLLVLAKFVGACGMFRQMAVFQESTQMPGGTEFVVRFLTTEAARLGYSRDEYLEDCNKRTAVYTSIMDAVQSE